eukprot:TRINITY_DN381_c1_g1_i1.p3 TRINITY_DN381_c1_g1~~TRINITY_DN381_c1_g1_i1.p3  ORF type:complete len:128 (+),score=9.56 TRINITY_DN381_c1_g1_i1:163-546(+)
MRGDGAFSAGKGRKKKKKNGNKETQEGKMSPKGAGTGWKAVVDQAIRTTDGGTRARTLHRGGGGGGGAHSIANMPLSLTTSRQSSLPRSSRKLALRRSMALRDILETSCWVPSSGAQTLATRSCKRP